jgi:Prp8 binding protein
MLSEHALTGSVLWRSSGSCENYGILTGHKQAILDLHWSRDSNSLFSASADMHLASWDVETGARLRRHPGHSEVINCMDVSKRIGRWLYRGECVCAYYDTVSDRL